MESAHGYAVQLSNLWCTFLDEKVRRLFASAGLNKTKGLGYQPGSLPGTCSELL